MRWNWFTIRDGKTVKKIVLYNRHRWGECHSKSCWSTWYLQSKGEEKLNFGGIYRLPTMSQILKANKGGILIQQCTPILKERKKETNPNSPSTMNRSIIIHINYNLVSNRFLNFRKYIITWFKMFDFVFIIKSSNF